VPRLLLLASSRAQFVHFDVHAWQWAALVALIATLVLGDLFVLHREEREVALRTAAIESAVWIALGLSWERWDTPALASPQRGTTVGLSIGTTFR